MAGLTKTWSGDLTEEIAGRILNAINNYDEDDAKDEASPSVKQAAKNLGKDDGATKVTSSSIVVKDAIIPVHIEVVNLGKETKKLSGKVTAIGTGLADTQKLIGTQNEMLEQKFDTILALLSGGTAGGGEGGTAGRSGGASGTGGVQKVSLNAGDRLSAFFGRKFMMRGARALLRRGTRMLPRGLKRNLLRMRNAPRRVGKKVLRKAVTKFATSGVGKKIGTKIGAKAITKGVGKGVGKSLAKKVPILGAVMGTVFAVDRLRKGDFLGAGLEMASGIASIFPGIGTGISVGLDAALIARDIAGEGGKKQQQGNGNVQSNSSQGGSRTISGYERGSGGTNVMGFFQQAGSLLVSSILPVAAATGTLAEVKAQVKDAGLDYAVVSLPPPSVKMGEGKVETPAQVKSKDSKIPGFNRRKEDKTPTTNQSQPQEKGILGKTGDLIKGGAKWLWEAPGRLANWVIEGTKENIQKVKTFVSNTAEKVNNSAAANKVRDVIGSEKGDGFIGPKWMGIRNPFAKKGEEDTSVKSETPVTGEKETVSGNMTPDQRNALNILAKYESSAWGYNAVNQYGAKKGRVNFWTNPKTGEKSFVGDFSNMKQHGGRALTDLTVAEVLALQAGYNDSSISMEQWVDSGKLHAVGRYQFVGNTLPGLVERSGISPDLKFDKRTQDILALQLMSERGISPWVGPSDKATTDERAVIKRAQKQPVPSYEKGGILTSPPSNVAMKAQQVQHASASIDEIEDQEPAQPIVYLTNMEVSSTPLVIPKSSSRKDDFVNRYRFMSLGAA